MPPDDALAELLAWNRRFGPYTNTHLSNHCSMGLIALQRLGADADRLQLFADDYAPKLDPIGQQREEIDDDSLASSCGTARRFPDLLAYYTFLVDRDGWEAVLTAHLPPLLHALGTDAFHPLIRLAYGVDAADPHEIAAGLAYLADAPRLFRATGPDPTHPGTDPPEEPCGAIAMLERIRAHPVLGHVTLEGFSIVSRMMQVEALDGFETIVASYHPGDDALRELASAALRFYAPRPHEFTPMHSVTSLHALRILLPWVGDGARAYRLAAQALAAAFVADASPPLQSDRARDELETAAVPSWDAIRTAAIESRGDEHVHKVAYTASSEASQWGDDAGYRSVAAALAGCDH